MRVAAARTPKRSYSKKVVGYDPSKPRPPFSVFGNYITLKAGAGTIITVVFSYSTIHNGKEKSQSFHATSIYLEAVTSFVTFVATTLTQRSHQRSPFRAN